MCERFVCLMVSGSSTRDLGGVIPSPEGKRSMMKLGQRMVNNFGSSVNPSSGKQWNTLPGSNEFEVRATLRKSTDPGQPNGVVLSAAATNSSLIDRFSGMCFQIKIQFKRLLTSPTVPIPGIAYQSSGLSTLAKTTC